MSKFLSYEDRLIIAQCIQENVSFRKIEKELERNRTTIAREIKSTLTIRSVAVLGIRIIPVSYELHAKSKNLWLRMYSSISL